MGAPGTADPVTTITKTGDTYHITIQAIINGQSITLLDQSVSSGDVIAEDAGEDELTSTPPAKKEDEVIQDSENDEKEIAETPIAEADPPMAEELSPDPSETAQTENDEN